MSLLDHLKRVPNKPDGLEVGVDIAMLTPTPPQPGLTAANVSPVPNANRSGEPPVSDADVSPAPAVRPRSARDEALSELKFRILEDLVRSLDADWRPVQPAQG